jgi:hypothetical protein
MFRKTGAGPTDYELASLRSLGLFRRCLDQLVALGVTGARAHRYSDGRFGLELAPEAVERLTVVLEAHRRPADR